MSFKIVKHSVLIDSSTLLDLFLGKAEIQVLDEKNIIFIHEINDQHLLSSNRTVQTHSVKISGTSSNPKIVDVGGMGTITVPSNKNGIVFDLEIHLEDGND